MNTQGFFNPKRCSFIKLFLLFLLSISIYSIPTKQIIEPRPIKTISAVSGSSRFDVALDFDQAFDVKITSFNEIENVNGFCDVAASQLSVQFEWNHPLSSTESTNYEKIAYYNGYYFVLDSVTFELLATKDFQNPHLYFTIPTNVKNTVNENNQPVPPFLVIDPQGGMLYIITSKLIASYSLGEFITAAENKNTIPTITKQITTYPGYQSVSNVKFYQGRLYITADKYTEVYSITLDRDVISEKKLDGGFFNEQALSIVDTAVEGNYIYLLDGDLGVFIVEISQSDSVDAFTYRSDLRTITLKQGTFIEVVNNSVQITYSNASLPAIREYIIQDVDSKVTGFAINIDSYIDEVVQQTYSDENFVYLISNFANLIVKHSVPAESIVLNNNDDISEFWTLSGIKSIVTIAGDDTSSITALQSGAITQYTVTRKDPVMICRLTDVNPGVYFYKLDAIQPDCPTKDLTDSGKFDVVCAVDQTIILLITNPGDQIGNTSSSDALVLYLTIGVGVLVLIVVVFALLFRKYKSQYQLLEDQMKNQHDSAADRSHKSGSEGDDKTPKKSQSPKKAGIKLEFEPIEVSNRDRGTMNALNSISKDEIKPKASEFGDLKPLDIEEIYGSGKGKGDTSF